MKYVYTLVSKETEIPLVDVAYSRQEARNCKNLYENLYKQKYKIVRYARDAVIR